ncbi:MAG: Fic family protein [Raoultibacter sp.]
MVSSNYSSCTREAIENIEAVSSAAIDGANVDIMSLLAPEKARTVKSASEKTTRARRYKQLIQKHNSAQWIESTEFNKDFLFDLHAEFAYRKPSEFNRKFRGQDCTEPHKTHSRLPQNRTIAPSEIEKYVDDLLKFCDNDLYPTQIQAALVHFQIEYIRPFKSYNEALGRHLSYAIYARRKFCKSMLMPAAMEALSRVDNPVDDKRAIGPLANRPMDLWIYHSGKILSRGAHRILDIEKRFMDIEENWQSKFSGFRKNDFSSFLIHDLLKTPIITSQYIQETYQRTAPAAGDAIEKLIERKIIYPLNDNRRYRVFFAKDVLDLYYDLLETALPKRWIPGWNLFDV